jgi:hypothetical protein
MCEESKIPVIRTFYQNDDVWLSLKDELTKSYLNEELPVCLDFIDNKNEFESASTETLVQSFKKDEELTCIFVANEDTFSHPDKPLLLIDFFELLQRESGEEPYAENEIETVKIALNIVWEVESNISLGNSDVESLLEALEPDGIYRSCE